IFGGMASLQDFFNDVYELDLIDLEWFHVRTSGVYIEKRSGHSCCLIGDEMIVFGGNDAKSFLRNFVYSLDLLTDHWKRISTNGDVPPPMDGHSAIPYKENMVVFGGWDDKCPRNDVY